MTDAEQCPGCNRWSDRSDEVKELDGEFTHMTADRYFACIHPQCEVYMFGEGSTSGMKLNLSGIRDSGRTVTDVIYEKLDNYEFKNE